MLAILLYGTLQVWVPSPGTAECRAEAGITLTCSLRVLGLRGVGLQVLGRSGVRVLSRLQEFRIESLGFAGERSVSWLAGHDTQHRLVSLMSF